MSEPRAEGIAARLAAIQHRVDAACVAAGRDAGEVKLIAVSKTFPVDDAAAALNAGHPHLGESYAQELRDKSRAHPDAQWHFLGRIQRNKAKYIAPVAHRVHALQEVAHAEALSARAPETGLKCLVSVKLGGETTKGGVPSGEVLDRCRALSAVPRIEVVGLMTLPPFREDPEDVAPFFAELADLATRGRAAGLTLDELSMGMSHDFEVAIRHGATWVRVGTAIFGSRES